MAVDDVAHVEVVGILRHLLEDGDPPDVAMARSAAYQWLRENHPSPAAYLAAVHSMSTEGMRS